MTVPTPLPEPSQSPNWAAQLNAAITDRYEDAKQAAADVADTINTGRLSEASLTSTIATEAVQPARDAARDYIAEDPAVVDAAATRAVAIASDPVFAGVLADDESATRAEADRHYLRGTFDSADTIDAAINVNRVDAEGTPNSIIFAVPTPTSPHTLRGSAQLRLLLGGYDSILGDSLASTIIQGMHAEINDASSHGLIIGGSFQQVLDSHYSAAVAGTGNRIGNDDTPANYSTALAGHDNVIEAYHSATVAGWGNTITGAESVILAGRDSTTHGRWSVLAGHTNIMGTAGAPTRADYAAMLGGTTHQLGQTASGRFSGVLGGRDHRIDVEYAGIVGGRGARPNFLGSIAQAMGYFATPGDAQKQEAFFRGQSTDAFAKQLLVDEVGAITVPPSTTWALDGLITGQRIDAGGEEAATFYLRAMVRRVGNASVIEVVGTPVVEQIGATAGAETWTADIRENPTMPSVQIRGQGQAGKTINWGGSIRIVSITG